MSRNPLDEAVSALKVGGVVICPTDTVYGFLADAGNKKAVEKIFKIKKRPGSKPLPVFVKDLKMAKELAEINERQEKILKKRWPGKYTFVFKSKRRPDLFLSLTKFSERSGLPQTIALRIPQYKFLNNLLKKINRPLAQTSANVSGEPAMAKISDILQKFGERRFEVLVIDAGNLKKKKPSKIYDLTLARPERLR